MQSFLAWSGRIESQISINRIRRLFRRSSFSRASTAKAAPTSWSTIGPGRNQALCTSSSRAKAKSRLSSTGRMTTVTLWWASTRESLLYWTPFNSKSSSKGRYSRSTLQFSVLHSIRQIWWSRRQMMERSSRLVCSRARWSTPILTWARISLWQWSRKALTSFDFT